MTDKGQSRWSVSGWFWSVMHGKDASHDVFINVRAKGLIDLLCNF